MKKECDSIAMKEVTDFVDDLKEAISKKIEITAEFDKVCICGMGASAIGGDILADMVAYRSAVPVSIIRSMVLPNWVNENTLVIACSYSGNTRETLSMYDQATERNCKAIAITSGGQLTDRCEKTGNTLISIRPGVQPRNALGILLGYMANAMESLGVAECRTEIMDLIPGLYEFRDEIGFKNKQSYAKKIAELIHGKVPVIYSTDRITSSAVRWKQQINENSKMMAFSGSISDLMHNEMDGWHFDEKRNDCVPVFLYEEDASDTMKDIADNSVNALKAAGIEPVVIKIHGKTTTERSLRAIMFGDHVSLYLAFMKGVDPIQVRSIASFKERVSRLLNISNNR